jgi:hypothetical protein
MSSRFSRFLHLEHSRGEKPGSDGQVRLRDGGRFESVAGPVEAPPTVAVPEAHVERFKRHGETPLALDAETTEAQRFPRCMRCETDNGRFATTCTGCGADLRTPEQRAYTEQLWREREQAEARNQEQAASLQSAHRQAEAEQLAERRRYVEELARAMEKDRSFLGRLQPLFTPCLGVGLLRLIPHPLARWSTLAWAIGLPILLVRFGNESLRELGFSLGAFVFVLFVPTSLWTAGRRRDW